MSRSRPRFGFEPKTPVRRGADDVSDVAIAPKVGTPSDGMRRRDKEPENERESQRSRDRIKESPKAPGAPGVGKLKDLPDGGWGGSGGGSGGGGHGGDGHGGGHDGHWFHGKKPNIIIYCHCCGLPWWKCHWCHYWTPMYWWYYCYDAFYWNHCWYPKKWGTYFIDYHYHYNFVDSYPNIYTPPALALDPTSQAIELLDEGADLFRNGHYLDALHKFYLAMLVDLDFAVPKFAYAHALFALGIYDFAAHYIRLGFYLLPEWLEIGGDIKLMYGDEADFDEQLAVLMAHLKVWPGDEDAILVLGYVSYFAGDLYMAEKAFERLLTSMNSENGYVAGLFLDAIESIKEMMAANDPGSDLLVDDGVALEEILRK